MRRTLFAGVASLILTASAAPPARNESLRAFLQMRFQEVRSGFPETTYTSAFADLNGDGRAEALVYLYSGYFCGSGGCALYIYTPAGASWREVAELTIVNAPVRLLNTRSRGWRDLAVHVRGGGMDMPYQAQMRFDGRTYASNPSLAPPIRRGARGRVLIDDDSESRRLFQPFSGILRRDHNRPSDRAAP